MGGIPIPSNTLVQGKLVMAITEKEIPIDLQERLIRRTWEDEQFAELLRTNPRVAIAEETGIRLPDEVNIFVHQEDEFTCHLVIPSTILVDRPVREEIHSQYNHTPSSGMFGCCNR